MPQIPNGVESPQVVSLDLNDLDSLNLEQLVVLRDGLIELIKDVEKRIANGQNAKSS